VGGIADEKVDKHPPESANSSTPPISGNRQGEFEEFFRANYWTVVNTLHVAADDVEDAVQEAFVQAHLHWEKLSDYDEPVAWVRHVALRLLTNRRRGLSRIRKTMGLVDEPHPDQSGQPGAPSVEGIVESVRRLPNRQRIAVALFYFWDMPVAEIAEVMEASPGTVKATLHAARRSLRMRVENEDD
jgi:RNA polymerase sigma factor (sigma-70 family)